MSENFKSTGSIWIDRKWRDAVAMPRGPSASYHQPYFISVSALWKLLSLTTTFLGSEHTPKIFFHCCHSITANLRQCNLLKACKLPDIQTFLTLTGTEFKLNKKKIITLFRPTLSAPRNVSTSGTAWLSVLSLKARKGGYHRQKYYYIRKIYLVK